ncbi:hypothetical protein BPTFM16_00219 [Altererythrobacter insulae]|nr:hypothetical protein BPTFM16_00219 [Altererythrobacter insulae]
MQAKAGAGSVEPTPADDIVKKLERSLRQILALSVNTTASSVKS